MLLGTIPFESEARRWGDEVYFGFSSDLVALKTPR
jgi:hypothetical protein